MKWISRLLFFVLVASMLSACGGTGTGNPSNDMMRNGAEGCDPEPFICSDGTSVYRQGASCEFDPCP